MKHARSASPPSTRRPTGTPHGPASVSPGLAVTSSTRSSRVERAVERDPVPPRRDLELARARCASPTASSPSRGTRAARGGARSTMSVVSPYSQRFENGDQTTAPPPCRVPVTEVGVGERGRVDADESVAHAVVLVEERELARAATRRRLRRGGRRTRPVLQAGCGGHRAACRSRAAPTGRSTALAELFDPEQADFGLVRVRELGVVMLSPPISLISLYWLRTSFLLS